MKYPKTMSNPLTKTNRAKARSYRLDNQKEIEERRLTQKAIISNVLAKETK